MSYYEHRYTVLRRLEDAGLLRDFNIHDERIAVQLGDAHHRIAFGPKRVEAMLLNPNGEIERVTDALRILDDALGPDGFTRPVFGFQWLKAIDLDYDEVKACAVQALLGVGGAATANDFACSVDGRLRDLEVTYTLEFGIVEQAEIGPRLARLTGKVRATDREVAPSLWASETLPKVAFFCDSLWKTEYKAESLTELVESWAEIRKTAANIVGAFIDRVGLSGEEASGA